MTKFVPYLPEEAIERDAALLLAEYAQARGVIIAPPIPIEDIVEKRGLADKFRKRCPGQLADELHEIVEVLEHSGPMDKRSLSERDICTKFITPVRTSGARVRTRCKPFASVAILLS